MPDVEVNPVGMTPGYRWPDEHSKRGKIRPAPLWERTIAWFLLTLAFGGMVYALIAASHH